MCSRLDILLKKKLIVESENREGKLILNEIVSMLVGLIKSNSDRMYEQTISYSGYENKTIND